MEICIRYDIEYKKLYLFLSYSFLNELMYVLSMLLEIFLKIALNQYIA